MSKLILVRHGESSGNRDRIYAISPHDLPLTELGYRQAQQAAKRIAELFHPELVVTSSYKRASETARIIAGALALPLDRVSVKFKTAEGVGTVGQGLSAEAQAIILISRTR